MSVETVENNTIDPEWYPLQIQEGLSEQRRKEAFIEEIREFNGGVFFTALNIPAPVSHQLFYFDGYTVYVHERVLPRFREKFAPFLNGDKPSQLVYDNLINVCIMVKNAGDGFREVLTKNLPYMDRYTILDTGSTDNTITIIKEVLANKRGDLYEEPFINFRDSRNRLLDLAGDKCHFNIMLDDTYILHGNIREFLNIARGDDVVDSFSIVIEDIDTMYSSNRVTKPPRGLRYENLIHEIIQPSNNLNVAIPYKWGHIEDSHSEYMITRTKARKQQDIDTLISMLDEDPTNARTYYYIADSYICMKDWENALAWFHKRVEMKGYDGEYQDSLYYIAVIKHMYLYHPWKDCHDWYLKCYEANPLRAESLYFVGKHYYDNNMNQTAFLYMKKAYDLGMPDIQMSVRKHIYNFHIPKDLSTLCYDLGEYKLGEEAIRKALLSKDDSLCRKWLYIFYHINQGEIKRQKTLLVQNKLIVFVSPGGWNDWDGETLRTRGLGGSENFSIRYAEQLIRMGYTTIVFCKTPTRKDYNDVIYLPIIDYPQFVSTYAVDVAIINRFPEYIPVTCLNGVRTYYVMHDIASEGDIIALHNNLAGTLCISEWHKQQFLYFYPACASRTSVISYGLDTTEYPQCEKEKYMFIYPNFPNRGLLQLLHMWPRIVQKYPSARLHTFCNTQNEWCQKHWKADMEEVDSLLELHKDTVINHGWVNGETLRLYWARAHVWFYPCTFAETCCLTAWEAAASKTLAVTNHLAALKESVGDRGVITQGDAKTIEWQNEAISALFNVLDTNTEHEYTEKNYEWVLTKNFPTVVSDFVQKYVI